MALIVVTVENRCRYPIFLGLYENPTTDEASSSGFFFDLVTDITPQSITVAEVTSGGTTTNFNIDANIPIF